MGMVRGQLIQNTLRNRLDSLGQSADAERLRLALVGANVAVFDWTIADDQIVWEGAASLLEIHPDREHLQSGQAFRGWLGHEARSRLLAFIDEPSPSDPAFTV